MPLQLYPSAVCRTGALPVLSHSCSLCPLLQVTDEGDDGDELASTSSACGCFQSSRIPRGVRYSQQEFVRVRVLDLRRQQPRDVLLPKYGAERAWLDDSQDLEMSADSRAGQSAVSNVECGLHLHKALLGKEQGMYDCLTHRSGIERCTTPLLWYPMP